MISEIELYEVLPWLTLTAVLFFFSFSLSLSLSHSPRGSARIADPPKIMPLRLPSKYFSIHYSVYQPTIAMCSEPLMVSLNEDN
jgi:hypothetical protein